MDCEELLLLLENRAYVTDIDLKTLLAYRPSQHKDSYKVRAVFVAYGYTEYLFHEDNNMDVACHHLGGWLLKERNQIYDTINWVKRAQDGWYVKPKSTVFEEIRNGWRGRELDGDREIDTELINRKDKSRGRLYQNTCGTRTQT
jgi:hypothetical protein